MNGDPRRNVPRTDRVLDDPRLKDVDRGRAKVLAREQLERVRRGEIRGEDVVPAVVEALHRTRSRVVLNATGVVLHTNLGRAALSEAAVSAVAAAAGYTDVELDLDSGKRAKRGRGAMGALSAAVPRAQAVHLLNNGAAALLLAATGLARGKEIVVSRGELVEIGDGFRLPELLESTGARLREVGTTNRTSLADYANAIGPGTGFVLKVHPSNFYQRGFVAAVPVRQLATLDAPLVVDIGSGLLAPDPVLPDEPDVDTVLREGAGLVTASGDKLLGGPQAGLLLGRADLVNTLRRHPLARALRVDKLTLAAVEATLTGGTTPTHRALHATVAQLRPRVERLAAAVQGEVVDAVAVVGGGGAPELELPSIAVALPEELARPLRLGEPAVVGRVERGRLLLDLRCVPEPQDAALADAVRRASAPGAAAAHDGAGR
ncbi:L-seryl-tRNA(Sec) selenium transferase [Dactylosporangium sucinum]|uniref:L-seryl-tRNA(Sec) selenium transferase n=1 Tax=Dactylosporangium sucinum TaxID=1424081 RepID=A0A917U9Q7_9ACTN|nr:L-seryl-tRNA(Sec) selenium transferase [Dactylosporangium sucinum]GGM69224.1 L-seryl-tRNA(Sec) selenium transferase [Dactylosporangium sucinum]